MEIRLAGISKESVVDGPGFRHVLFAQGCIHGCKGCHNPDTHDLKGGYLVNVDDVVEDILRNPYIDGVTFSGGDPFLQAEAFSYIAERIRKRKIHIVSYTGFTYEEILNSKNMSYLKLLTMSDILIDGRYIEELRDLGLAYRGSKNQRIIDVMGSLAEDKIVIQGLHREAS